MDPERDPTRDSPPEKPELPPGYDENSEPNLTAAFAKLALNQRGISPSVDECIAHLKLLEAINQLRDDVATQDGLYGLKDSMVPETASDKTRSQTLTHIREKRWAVYVNIAVKRFQKYFQTLQPESRMIDIETMKVPDYEYITHVKEQLKFDVDRLPPLDVLMVLHSFMLNPRNYLADCIRYGKMELWASGMPWKAVDAAINNDSFAYNPGEKAQKSFEATTGFPWDNLQESPYTMVRCPSCRTELNVPWTTCEGLTPTSLDSFSLDRGRGYADSEFAVRCTCSRNVNHDYLRGTKFTRDVQKVVLENVPMPGGYLSMNGKPGQNKWDKEVYDKTATYYLSFPTRLIKEGGMYKSFCDSTQIPANVKDIRSAFEIALGSPQIVLRAHESKMTKYRVHRDERIAIRKMLACYWGNSSIFSMDLVGAVIRQGSFVEKMHAIDWLHSPALRHTMDRLVTKYQRFVQIMAQNPKETAVPTLDVDLGWHTHQLNPVSYYNYTVSKTSTFIDHDDKIEENVLSTAFEWTSKTYEKMFNAVYSECTCWYCEAIRESHASKTSRLISKLSKSSSRSAVASDLDRLHSATDPADPTKSVHVSAHNAVKGEHHPNWRTKNYVRDQQLERAYKKAVRRAEKEGRAPPARDDVHWGMAYGYPVYMPFYYPYMGDPFITPGFYAANPGCANFMAGAAGNCAMGTCGMAAGATCGAGGFSCGGGSMGGCGMGGGGGCGGGGGGGCGGGGGGGCGGGGGG